VNVAFSVWSGLDRGPFDEEGDSKTSLQRRSRKRFTESENDQVRDLRDSSHEVFVGQERGEFVALNIPNQP